MKGNQGLKLLEKEEGEEEEELQCKAMKSQGSPCYVVNLEE